METSKESTRKDTSIDTSKIFRQFKESADKNVSVNYKHILMQAYEDVFLTEKKVCKQS